jgi:hypothetical protein
MSWICRIGLHDWKPFGNAKWWDDYAGIICRCCRKRVAK